MPNVFLTADEHHGHHNINRLCDRPFETSEHATAEIVRRHNKVVGPGDLTFHLGDFWFGPRDNGRMAETVTSLNGEHVLVLGNHDRASVTETNGWAHQRSYLDAGFTAVVDVATLTLPAVKASATPRRVLLSHFPYTADHMDNARYNQFRVRDEGRWLIHGHVHNLYTVRQRGVNVGVDVWDFTPVNVHEVARLIADTEAGT